MKNVLFFVVLFFVSPMLATTAMSLPVQTEIVKEHGIVIVSQGRTNLVVEIDGDGLFLFELVNVASGKSVASRTGEHSEVYNFAISELPKGSYQVIVQFADGQPIIKEVIIA